MRMLVTGGCGFTGSAFARTAVGLGHDIRVLDSLGHTADLRNLDGVKHQFLVGDVTDPGVVAEAMKDMEAVVHFAAGSHIEGALSFPGESVRTNLLGTHVVLEGARKTDADFVYISTAEVYGPVEDGVYCTESAPMMPTSPHSASRAGGDRLAYSYFRNYGLRVMITRGGNNYGPGQHSAGFIPGIVRAVLSGEPAVIHGSGLNVRDWIHTEDSAAATMAVMQRGLPGEAYNIGSGQEIRNIDLARRILGILGKGELEMAPDRPGQDHRYGINSQKVRSLGWHPRRELAGDLPDTVDWYVRRFSEHDEQPSPGP